jgi:transposase
MSTHQDTPVQGVSASPKRRTYRQNWPAYNAAQAQEKARVADLLSSMCEAIPSPLQQRGRPRIPLGEALFAAAMKVYGGASGRRTSTDLREYEAKGYLSRAPHYNSVFKALENPALTPILKSMIEEAALPLRDLEQDFAVDSTGFSTATYRRWFDHKYGQKTASTWIKAHAMVGVRTNVVTSIELGSSRSADCPQLPTLLDSTASRFSIRAVSADRAYISHRNLATIEAVGAKPLIPFKSNQRNRGGAYWLKGPRKGKNSVENRAIWSRNFDYFTNHRRDFLKNYHQRSNVETTFSMIKAKFGAFVRSRTTVAQHNELLCKVLCHNLCCLVQASFEHQADAA